MQLDETLGVNYNDDKPWLNSIKSLRILIGVLGMLLPLLLYFFLYIDNGHTEVLESISHYYYTRANTVFIIVLSLLAIFLIIYKHEKPIDFYVSSIAGIFALMVIIFPTDNITDVCCDPSKPYNISRINENSFRVNFHYVSAAIFLGCLTFMSLCLFTKSNSPKNLRTPQKNTRNIIYTVCGVLMLIALLVMFIGGFLKCIPGSVYNDNRLTFWMETLAVECFGISWLVKGEVIFGDDKSLN